MDASEISHFLVASLESYVAERIAAGDDDSAAARTAEEQLASMFPGGEAGPGHLLYCIEDDGERVGSLWIGTSSDERPGEWWIWDIAVDESRRGRGVGRQAMLLAESEARAQGAMHLGLSVFGHNEVARHLYETLGYRAVAIRMSKIL